MSRGVITRLEVQKRSKERVNVYIDGAFAFGLSLIDAARLKKGQTLSEAEITALQRADAVGKAIDQAARFLGIRPRSTAEVRRHLAGKDIPAEVIEAAIERLTMMGHLDDLAFAHFWIQNRNEFKPVSRRALRQELRRKGVEPGVIDAALSEQDEPEAAYRAARGQVRRVRERSRREFKAKLSAFLARRGFSFSTIDDVVSRLMDELEAEDPERFTRTVDNED